MESKSFITPFEFAKAIQTTVEAVRYMCRTGRLAAQKTSKNGHWRIKASELTHWLEGFGDGKGAGHGSR
jgi:hypothetical protein